MMPTFDVVAIDQFSALLYSNFSIVTENEQNVQDTKKKLPIPLCSHCL